MRYTSFEIKNFKGIHEARLDLATVSESARIYTLVGLNESGKTTVLQAIDHFQPADDGDEVTPKMLAGWTPPDRQELIPVADRANFNGSISIKCGIDLDENDVTAIRNHLRRHFNGFRLDDINRSMTIEDNYEYANSKFQKKKSRWVGLRFSGYARTGTVKRTIASGADAKWQALAEFIRARLPVIWFFPTFLFDFPDRIYVEPHDTEDETNRFYRALFQDILDALDQDLTLEDHVIGRARSGTASDLANLQQVLLQAGREVTETVVAAWNRIFGDKPMTADKRIHINYGIDEDNDRVYVTFALEDADGFFAIGERSLGFRWFFVYLLMTAYRGRRKTHSKDLLFLFDEPASNLHQTAQGALLSSFRDLSEQAMIIYTTHSHHLIEPTWLGSAFVVTNEGLDPTTVSSEFTASRTNISIHPYRQFAARHPSQSQYFQPILDVLDYAPSGLEFVPSIVMVEGKTDFYVLSYFEQFVLDTPADERLTFLPGGGAGTLDEPIQLYIGWARPFVALLDSDEGGRRERDRYVEKFGEVVRANLIDLGEASGKPTAKAIESLLPSADKLALQRVADPEAARYSKKAFARGVQEALITGQTVSISAEGKTTVRKLAKALREALVAVEATG